MQRVEAAIGAALARAESGWSNAVTPKTTNDCRVGCIESFTSR